MALNVGVTPCVLRSVLQQRNTLVAWFAPIRGPRYSSVRTIFAGHQLDNSSPDKDIRVVIPLGSDQADDLLLMGIVAKLERAPIQLIDGGVDGSDPILLTGRLPQLTAGSMGLVIPVTLMDDQSQALASLIAGPSVTIKKLWALAISVFDQFPASMRSLLPEAPLDLPADQDGRAWSLSQMVRDLVMIAPLITGSFASAFGRSTRADLQDLASFGGFSGMKLRELVEDDLQNEKLVLLLRTLVGILSDRSFPVWTVMILEDILVPLIQELIRYLPPLLHLRSAPWYGAQREECPITDIDGSISTVPIIEIDRSISGREEMLGDLSWYDRPRSFSMEDRFKIRNMMHQLDPDSTAEIPGRPDLSMEDTFTGADWDRKITAYIQRMSSVHDPGTFPTARTVKHILDQFHCPLSGEYASNTAGLGVGVVYHSIQRV